MAKIYVRPELGIKVQQFEETKPVIKLDDELCFEYKGYKFELTSCNMLVSGTQIKQLDGVENYRDVFPHGIFSDRYVCWMYGHKDDNGKTKEQSDVPEYWCPEIYLVPEAWAWGADYDCLPNEPVNDTILKAIDKFLEQNPDL